METKLAFVKRHSFFFVVAGFLCGVFLSSLVNFSINFSLFLIFLSLILSGYFFFSVKEKEIRFSLIILPLTICALGLGVLRYEIKGDFPIDPTLTSLVGEKVAFEGVVVSEPEKRESFTQAVLAAEKIVFPVSSTVSGKLLIRVEHYPEISYGDRVRIEGKLELPKGFETESGRQFDYAEYLSKDNIAFILSFSKAEVTSSGQGNSLKATLLSFKNKFISSIEKNLPEPYSALSGGIILGVKSSLGKELEEKLRRTAIVHIVVLSGYNITLVTKFVISLLFFVPRRRALIISIIGVILFALMVGGEPSVLRATLMGILAAIAGATGRRYDISRALAFTAGLMVLWNPKILVLDFGFQLSFLATLALIWLAPVFEKKFKFIPEKLGLREVTAATLSTQLFVLPLLLYQTGALSLVGVFVNLLVLPVVPIVMFSVFITGGLGLISSWLTFPFAAFSQVILFYVLKVVEFFSALPLASIQISNFPISLMFAIYSTYALLMLNLYKRNRKATL